MRLSNAVCLIALMLASGGIALAQGSDPIVVPSRGPTGSLGPFSTTLDLPLGNGTVQDAYTVLDGQTATEVSIVMPSADFTDGESVTCGISNAFLDGGLTELINGTLGFAPTSSGTGASATETCSWTTFTGVNNDPPGLNETVKQMEAGCYLTNLTNRAYNDSDDCAGVPGVPGGANNDVVFYVTGAVTTGSNTEIVADSVITPEPGSASLLLLGLGGLIFFARRKQLS